MTQHPILPPFLRLAVVLGAALALELSASEPPVAGLPVPATPASAPVPLPDFGREVLPILSEHCLSCHGPDEQHRKAKLRLDQREGALELHEGRAAIVPGQPALSAMLSRVRSDDPDEAMPPPESRKPRLTPAQIAVLARWIEGGAPWGRHWAFVPPLRPPVPAADGVQPIDAFVRARLRAEGLAPAPEAARHTLLRRVSYDLTGLPPTPAELDAFLADRSPGAYAAVVDRLLASPHFGERMAMWWLDAARYADTDGFQADEERSNWPWRDWVVEAFNHDQPFDRFTIEQFAGDLLPAATAEQRLATCFHRNHMTNGEGGRDPEESRIDYVRDRVNTTGTLWLGLTLGCAQCHSHKFDPITHADYYSLAAFFDSIDEDGSAGRKAKPYLPYASPQVARAVAEAQQLVDERAPREARARAEAAGPFAAWLAARAAEVRGGYSAWRPLRATTLASSEGTRLSQEDDGTVQAGGPDPRQDDYRLGARVALARVTGLKLEVFPHPGHTNGSYSRGPTGFFVLTDLKLQVSRRGSAQLRDIAIAGAIADAGDDPAKHQGYGAVKDTLDDDPRNGWSTRDSDPHQPRTAVFALAEPLALEPDEELVVELRQRSTLGGANIGRFRLSVTDQRGPAVTSLQAAPLEQLAAAGGSCDAALRGRLFEQFLADHQPYLQARAALERARRQLAEVAKAAQVEVMVLAERAQPRTTHVLLRGVWDQRGEQVTRRVPPALSPWPADAPRDRLGLARWLVARDQPLTARVVANHLWQLCFGAGLVRTPDDFGLQGERPTHPELLDWLAVELMESGWDVKRLLRLIVTSATYRQSSAVDEALLARDPGNRLLARGARFRLPSWMLRDGALRAAGLLNPALGGPPVRPYQPEGVWEELFMGRLHYEASEGAAQYRRTLYAFWRRTIAPTFLFDTAQRRSCEVRAARTNTPLQALTLLNDTGFLEAARALAALALRGSGGGAARLSVITRRVLGRDLEPREAAVLERELERARAHYHAHPADAARLLAVGQAPPDASLPADEAAAWMMVANLILNLDEAITHE